MSEIQIEPVVGVDALTFATMTFPRYRAQLGTPNPRVLALGAYAPGPCGLILGEVRWDGVTADVLSVFTKRSERRRGVAKALWAALEEALAARGVRRLEAHWEEGRPSVEAVEALLRGRGFSAPRPRAWIGRTSLPDDSPVYSRLPDWCARPRLPERSEVFPWVELRAEEREALLAEQGLAEQGQPGGFPEALDPFREEELLEPLNSVGLRLRGELVGWSITHRIAPELIRYTALYVRERLQHRAYGAGLWATSFLRHIALPKSERPGLTFAVYPETPAMIKFTERRIAPFLESWTASLGAAKALGPET